MPDCILAISAASCLFSASNFNCFSPNSFSTLAFNIPFLDSDIPSLTLLRDISLRVISLFSRSKTRARLLTVSLLRSFPLSISSLSCLAVSFEFFSRRTCLFSNTFFSSSFLSAAFLDTSSIESISPNFSIPFAIMGKALCRNFVIASLLKSSPNISEISLPMSINKDSTLT